MNVIALPVAEKMMATRVAPVGCIRVYELSHRKTKHENDFGKFEENAHYRDYGEQGQEMKEGG